MHDATLTGRCGVVAALLAIDDPSHVDQTIPLSNNRLHPIHRTHPHIDSIDRQELPAMEASEPLPEAPEQGTAKSAQQPISSSTLTLQPLTLSLPLQSSSGSGFVILDEDDEDDLEISIPLDGGDGGASVEEASAVPVDAPAALDPPASTAVEPVPIEQEPLPQQVEGAEDEDDFFTGDEAFIFAAVATLPAPSVSEPEALTAAEPDAAAAAPVTASAEEEEIALTASSSPVPLEQPEQPMLTPVADPEPPQQPEEPEQQPPAPMAAPEPAPAEAEDDDFGDFAVPTEVVPPSSTASQPEPATEPVPAAAVQLGDFEAPPAVDAPTLAPQKPEPPMEPSAPAAVAATDGGGEQEAAEEDEFGDFEAPAPMPPAPPGVATPPPATAEAAEAEASLAATVPTQEPHAAGSGFEHDDFDDFGDDMEFVSASPLAPAPAPAMLPPAEAPPQEAAVVPAAPIHAPSAAPDAGDPHTFFKAAYGQGLQQPPAGKAPSWAAGQRRRLLAELDANLEARCQVHTSLLMAINAVQTPQYHPQTYTDARPGPPRAPRQPLGRRHPPQGAAGHHTGRRAPGGRRAPAPHAAGGGRGGRGE